MPRAPVDDGTERQRLAGSISVAAIIGITLISLAVILLSDHHGEAADHVMASVLPLFGSWIATVLAYYVARENLRAATSSVSTLLAPPERSSLDGVSVKDKMIERTRIVSLSDKFDDLSKALLKDVVKFLDDRRVSRSPILDKSGAVLQVVHRSVIDEFIRKSVAADPLALDKVKWAEMLEDAALKKVLDESFGLVSQAATLADARAKMTEIPDCEDVFVTKTGTKGEPLLGWITDNVVLEANR